MLPAKADTLSARQTKVWDDLLIDDAFWPVVKAGKNSGWATESHLTTRETVLGAFFTFGGIAKKMRVIIVVR